MSTSFDAVKDSGERREFGTGSVRDVRTGKGRYDLLPALAIKRLAQHYENGAVKYGDNNWKLGQPLSGYLDSGLRHTFNVLDLQVDEDHPAAAIWNMVSFLWTAEEIRAGRLPRELDDIGYVAALEEVPEEPTGFDSLPKADLIESTGRTTHLTTDGFPECSPVLEDVHRDAPDSNALEFTAVGVPLAPIAEAAGFEVHGNGITVDRRPEPRTVAEYEATQRPKSWGIDSAWD